ncbi:MAG: pyridoxal phosphate-dependent decarboxylase family protein [Candidatus Promineifilaceae bacterium]
MMFADLAEKALFEQAQQYAYSYIDAAYERHVYPTDDALADLSVFDEALPDEMQAGADILSLLDQYGSPATVAQTGGRYFGFVNGNAIPTALAARWLSDVWDQNSALHVMSPIVAKLEQVCERWAVDLLGLSAETAAGFVSGTSIATLCGLAAGRYALLKKQGWDVNEDGLFGAPPIRVVVSEQAHGTVLKALALLGLGKGRIERVPADDQGRIDVSQLPELDATTLVILQAGHVSTGSFDDFEAIGKLAQSADAWVHIDGAFGLWAAASPNLKHLTKGIELADSWSVDGHKTLNTPYDCAIVLCKRREILAAAMQATGAYIQWGNERDNMLLTPDMSRRARAVELWATLRFLGRSGLASMLEELVARAQQFAGLLREAGFQIQNDVVFNQVLVMCDSAEQTTATMTAIQSSGECWAGGTRWNGDPAIRISVCSWATTSADIERSANAFIAARNAQLNS